MTVIKFMKIMKNNILKIFNFPGFQKFKKSIITINLLLLLIIGLLLSNIRPIFSENSRLFVTAGSIYIDNVTKIHAGDKLKIGEKWAVYSFNTRGFLGTATVTKEVTYYDCFGTVNI